MRIVHETPKLLGACAFKECANPGIYEPQLIMPQPPPAAPLVIRLHCRICERCRRLPEQAIVTDEGYYTLCKTLGKKGYTHLPPRSECRLQFETAAGITIPYGMKGD